jgi:hypothetical protein
MKQTILPLDPNLSQINPTHSLFNSLKLGGNYMCVTCFNNQVLYFVFMGFAWFSL